MRRPAKAWTTGFDRRQANDRLRCAISTLAALALLQLAFAASASATQAAQFQRPFKETFGSVAQPTLPTPLISVLVAVDPSTGDVLVGSRAAKTITRYHADGTPSPFTALGGNVIDGKRGPGGHTRAECETAPEPASCDETPQNGLVFESEGRLQQISVSPISGDIYITQGSTNLVDIFSSTGKYLGQLTTDEKGAFNKPSGVTVDPAGSVYVAHGPSTAPRIAKYVPEGGAPPTNANVTATFPIEGFGAIGHLSAGFGPSAGWLFVVNRSGEPHTLKLETATGSYHDFAAGFNSLVSVNPATGNPLIQINGSEPEAAEFDGSQEVASTRLSLLRFQQGEISTFAFGPTGEVYVAPKIGEPKIFIYGQPAVVPTVIAAKASGVTGTKATLSGTVTPDDLEVTECFFEWGTTTAYGEAPKPCVGAIPTDSEPHQVFANLSNLIANGQTYHFRLAAKNANGIEYSADQAFTTAQTVVTDAASDVGKESATLNGTLRPEGQSFSECFFKYGLASSPGLEAQVPCVPSAGVIEPDFSPHGVSAAVTGLEAGLRYRFVLVANSGVVREGEEVEFTVLGSPQVREVRARDATQTSALIEASINPSGFGTSYFFQWGPTSSYGNQVPIRPEFVGSGTEAKHVTATLTGLNAATTYHYRIVATSTAGTTASPDQRLETLNGCGLPEGRCFEMVSPRNFGTVNPDELLGPVAQPGRFLGGVQMRYQAAASPGALAYVMETGKANATRGTELLYRGVRSSGSWLSDQISSGVTERNERAGTIAYPSRVIALSSDLSCAVEESSQPLTTDPVARLVIEAGGANLYRRNPDASYTLITSLPPENLDELAEKTAAKEYEIIGMSDDCGRVVFETSHHFSGVPGGRLYEWTQATGVRNVGYVPSGGGAEIATEAVGGSLTAGVTDQYRAVSTNGARTFFSAPRLVGNNPGEVGKTGVFVRINGTSTKDVSLSQTTTPNTGATFQGATPDGSRVYFTANAGLTVQGSSSGTDLYEYDLNSETLTDLSVGDGEGVAEVGGLIGVSDSGSHVYFIARGRLVPGQGGTRVQNQAQKVFSVYDAAGGTLRYVGAMSESGPSGAGTDIARGTVVRGTGSKTSRVSPDGRYLLFESSLELTGYQSQFREVFLYDAQGDTEPLVCISCRQDGKPPVNPATLGIHLSASEGTNFLSEERSLVIRGGRPEVFFISRDRLAEGAVENEWNLYEWVGGQVFHIATEAPGSAAPQGNSFIRFAGTSADGTDVYFFDGAALNWENPAARPAAWTARVGGGFPEPPPLPPSCNPTVDGSCQGPAVPAPSSPGANSGSFHGPGNVKPKKHKKKRKKHKKHGKHKKHDGKKHKNAKAKYKKSAGARHANGNGRAGK